MGVLRVRVLVDRREEASHTLRTQVECSLAVRRIRSVGQDRDVRHVVSRPALCCLVPPDDGLRARIWFAVSIARRSVVENAHVVRPGPCEVGIEAETSGIRLRVPAFGEVYPAAENPSVDPGPGRGRAVGLQVGYSLDQIAGLQVGARNVMQRTRSEEHTSELQSRFDLVCRLLLEKKKKIINKLDF